MKMKDFSSTTEEKKRKVPAKKRAAVKAKSKTSVYGWYIAGGVVAVSMAVFVYVLIM